MSKRGAAMMSNVDSLSQLGALQIDARGSSTAEEQAAERQRGADERSRQAREERIAQARAIQSSSDFDDAMSDVSLNSDDAFFWYEEDPVEELPRDALGAAAERAQNAILGENDGAYARFGPGADEEDDDVPNGYDDESPTARSGVDINYLLRRSDRLPREEWQRALFSAVEYDKDRNDSGVWTPRVGADGMPLPDPYSMFKFKRATPNPITGAIDFEYERKTEEEYVADETLRKQLVQRWWIERLDRMNTATSTAIIEAAKRDVLDDNIDENLSNPFYVLRSKNKISGFRAPRLIRGRDEKYQGLYGLYLFSLNEDLRPLADTPSNDPRWSEWNAHVNEVKERNKEARAVYKEEWESHQKRENNRAKQYIAWGQAQQFAHAVSEAKLSNEQKDDAYRRLSAKLAYPWEDTDPSTGAVLDLTPQKPPGVDTSSILYASYERKMAAHILKVETIQKLHYYMMQQGAPGTRSDYYYSGPYWRCRFITKMFAQVPFFDGLDATVPEYLSVWPENINDSGVFDGVYEKFLADEQRVYEHKQLARRMNVENGIGVATAGSTYPELWPCLTFGQIHSHLKRDEGIGYFAKNYTTFFDFFVDIRRVFFNAMFFNQGREDRDTNVAEKIAYSVAYRLLSGGTSGGVDRRAGIADSLLLQVVNGRDTCLDVELLRTQYEEYDMFKFGPDSDRLGDKKMDSNGQQVDQWKWGVRPAVPHAKHDHWLGQLVDQLASDPFAMPLYARFLAPRFYAREGNPLLKMVYDEIVEYQKVPGNEYEKRIATGDDGDLDLIARDVAENVRIVLNEREDEDPMDPIISMWEQEARRYTADGSDPEPSDLREAVRHMAVYLLKGRASFFADTQSRNTIHEVQYSEWRKSMRIGRPVTLDDIIERRRQAYYTGPSKDAVGHLKTDLETLFRTAQSRYADNNSSFDDDFDDETRHSLRINRSVFNDFTTICKRYYLTGFVDFGRSKKELDRKKADDNRVQRAANAAKLAKSRASSKQPQRAASKTTKQSATTKEDSVNAKVAKALRTAFTLNPSGPTLSRIDTIYMLRAEPYYEPDPDFPFEDEKGSGAAPSYAWIWRQQLVRAYLQYVAENATLDIFKKLVTIMRDIDASWISLDDASGDVSIDPSLFQKVGLHVLQRAYVDAQRMADVPAEMVSYIRGLDLDWAGPDTYSWSTERIKLKGVPPIVGVPRDVQARMHFIMYNRFAIPMDDVPVEDAWYVRRKADLNEGESESKEAADKRHREENEKFLKEMRRREENDPLKQWVDRNTGEIFGMDTVEFYTIFPPEPEYFNGGEAGPWWREIVKKLPQYGNLKAAAAAGVKFWDDNGIFAWRKSAEPARASAASERQRKLETMNLYGPLPV